MNFFEHGFCSSSLWRYLNRRRVLPWMTSGAQLGHRLLEIGAGYGAATRYFQERVSQVISLEYDANSLAKLRKQMGALPCLPVQGDAASLPFADKTFSSAVAILVLHHLKSPNLQDRAFSEAFRVLRPGGVFLAAEITESWVHHVGHIGSTYTPVAPASVLARLTKAGFSRVTVDFLGGGFRISAIRPGSSSCQESE
jgi:ubiquinone/menaquinone biosynthesis C-methylase UbiE